MSCIFSDLDFVKVCLNDILIHSYSNRDNYIKKLSIILEQLRQYKIKIKIYLLSCMAHGLFTS